MSPPARETTPPTKGNAKAAATSVTAGRKEGATGVDRTSVDDCRRELFVEEPVALELPEQNSQAANKEWIKVNGARGLIKQSGSGRTLAVVRNEMRLYKLGLDAGQEILTELGGFFKQPDETQATHNAWVKAHMKEEEEERKRLMPLRGEGRTAKVVDADISIAIAGAKAALVARPDALPQEASQAANSEWIESNGAAGVIKRTGAGRTVPEVRRGMEIYVLGANVVGEKAGLLTLPAETQAAHNAWVKAHLKDDEERRSALPLTGEGRDVASVASDIKLVLSGARHMLETAGLIAGA